MTNKLTQAELIDLAKQAGFKETRWSDILGVKVESLAKFAQLIQQPTSQESRQVEQGWDELRKVYFFTVIKGSEWDSNVLSDGTFRGCGIEQGFQTFKAAYSPEVIQALGVVLCDAEPVAEVVDSKLADFMPSHQKVEWHKTDFAVGTKFHAIKEQS